METRLALATPTAASFPTQTLVAGHRPVDSSISVTLWCWTSPDDGNNAKFDLVKVAKKGAGGQTAFIPLSALGRDRTRRFPSREGGVSAG